MRPAITLAVSIALHLAIASLLDSLPARAPAPRPTSVEVRLVAPPAPPPKVKPKPPPPPPKPEPEPEPEPEVFEKPPEAPPKVKKPRRRTRPVKNAKPSPNPVDTDKPSAPTERPTANADPNAEPVFGVDMASTSANGAGPAVQTGNTLHAGDPNARRKPGKVKGLRGAAPVPVDEVTKMPLPMGRCSGKYTEAARDKGIEGTVELQLIVGADGRTRDIKVVRGLGHGLDKAAITALKRCRFKPGRKGKEAIAVRIRSFKIRFYLDDGL